MSAERRRRVERLLDIRKTELDKRAGELSAAHERQRSALATYKAACEKTLTALAERDVRAKLGTSIEEWMGAEQWLARVKDFETLARHKLESADHEVSQARAQVAAARQEQEKIERLLLRLQERERQEQNRADQKTNDEAATARFLKRREQRA